ncbi:MAG: hypothetical protein AAF849_05790 [Bacteroidota bacterium]
MKFYFFAIPFLLFVACQTPSETSVNGESNPAAEGFNAADSDEKAIEIADQVMRAMGGRKNWDNTRYIAWTFFGNRSLFWDKQTGDVQITYDSSKVRLNIYEDREGIAYEKGKAVTVDSMLQVYLKKGKSVWINDAYWLVMPFKLKDSGVTLKYMGQDTIAGGEMAEVLALTFKAVGDTPNNKYLVYVTPSDKLVKQWDYYTNASDSLARFSTPWLDYQQYGNIMLSGKRGMGELTDIAVYDELPEDFEWLE